MRDELVVDVDSWLVLDESEKQSIVASKLLAPFRIIVDIIEQNMYM